MYKRDAWDIEHLCPLVGPLNLLTHFAEESEVEREGAGGEGIN